MTGRHGRTGERGRRREAAPRRRVDELGRGLPPCLRGHGPPRDPPHALSPPDPPRAGVFGRLGPTPARRKASPACRPASLADARSVALAPGRVPTARSTRHARRSVSPLRPGALGRCRDTLVALTTAPILDPAGDLPVDWRYVRPLTWSPPAAPGTVAPRQAARVRDPRIDGLSRFAPAGGHRTRPRADRRGGLHRRPDGPAVLEQLASNVTAANLPSS